MAMDRWKILISFLSLMFLSAARLGAQEASPDEVYAEIPGTRISLRLPEGFSLAEGFPGIVRQDSGAVVVTMEIASPLEKVLAGVNEQEMASDGMKLLRSEKVSMSGMDGTLFHISQEDPEGAVRKWILFFGNEKLTVMLAASASELLEASLGKTLEQCLLTAKWDAAKTLDPYAGMGFSLRESDVFEIRGRRPGGVLLARKDAPDELTPAEPILVVYPSASPEVAPIEILAMRQLTEGDQFIGFANFVERPLTVNGLNGYEIIADATESTMSLSVRILLVVVRTSEKDMIIQGIAAPESWEKYLPEFHALAESFQVTSAGHSGH